jgi:hypothetical protein
MIDCLITAQFAGGVGEPRGRGGIAGVAINTIIWSKENCKRIKVMSKKKELNMPYSGPS